MRSRLAGFSLIELSVVLLVIGIITAMGIQATFQTVEAARRTATENRMNAIEKALLEFRIRNNRLPCPANRSAAISSYSTYGVEVSAPGACVTNLLSASASGAFTATMMSDVVEDAVPTRTLGLPSEFMYDGWGRKFVYAVQNHATAPEAFLSIGVRDQCSITVNDASGTARTTGAIYVLLSRGPNGDGGILSNGFVPIDTTNANELINIHYVTPITPTFVQQDETTTDATDPLKTFDDIVRYKERWQLQSPQDAYNPVNNYQKFWFVTGRNLDAGNVSNARAYYNKCGKFMMTDPFTTVGVPYPARIVHSLAFTPDNNHIVAYSSLNTCLLYKVVASNPPTGTTPTVLAHVAGSFVAGGGSSCPATATTVKIALSQTGYLAIVNESGTVNMWKQKGDTFVALPQLSPGFNAYFVSFSKDGNYLAVASNTTDIKIYVRSGNNFAAMNPQPTLTVDSGIKSIAFSPSGKYFAVTMSGATHKLYVWSVSNKTFSAVTGSPFNVNAAGAGYAATINPQAVVFSADDKYIAMGAGSAATGNNGQDNIVIYKIDAGDALTRMALPTSWANNKNREGIAVAFSPDARYIVMLTTLGNDYKMNIFYRDSGTTYRYMGPMAYDAGLAPENSIAFYQ